MATEPGGSAEAGTSRASADWPLILFGVGSIVVGLLMVFFGRETIGTLILLFAVALGVWGLHLIVSGFGAVEPMDRTLRFFFGFGALVGASILFFGAEVSLPLLRILIGASLAVWGALDATGAFLRPGGRWWLFLLRGTTLVVVGLALVFVPQAVDVLALFLGIALVWWGLVEVAAGLRSGQAPTPAPPT